MNFLMNLEEAVTEDAAFEGMGYFGDLGLTPGERAARQLERQQAAEARRLKAEEQRRIAEAKREAAVQQRRDQAEAAHAARRTEIEKRQREAKEAADKRRLDAQARRDTQMTRREDQRSDRADQQQTRRDEQQDRRAEQQAARAEQQRLRMEQQTARKQQQMELQKSKQDAKLEQQRAKMELQLERERAKIEALRNKVVGGVPIDMGVPPLSLPPLPQLPNLQDLFFPPQHTIQPLGPAPLFPGYPTQPPMYDPGFAPGGGYGQPSYGGQPVFDSAGGNAQEFDEFSTGGGEADFIPADFIPYEGGGQPVYQQQAPAAMFDSAGGNIPIEDGGDEGGTDFIPTDMYVPQQPMFNGGGFQIDEAAGLVPSEDGGGQGFDAAEGVALQMQDSQPDNTGGGFPSTWQVEAGELDVFNGGGGDGFSGLGRYIG